MPIHGLDIRTFDAPDEEPPVGEKAHAMLVHVGGLSVWRFTFERGWRYTEHAESNLCTAPHAGYVVSGRLHVAMDDGTEGEAGPGSVVVIGPGHDAWTVGDDECILIDFGESPTR